MYNWIKSILAVIGIALAAIVGVIVALLGFLGLVILGLLPWIIKLGFILLVLWIIAKVFFGF